MGVDKSRDPALGPLSDSIIVVVSRLVDDAQTETREPSHSDIDFVVGKAGLRDGDPKAQGQMVGKAKRVRAALSWAMEHAPSAGQVLVASLISMIRGCGGFRSTSPNYVGSEVISDAINAFRCEGYELTPEGQLRSLLLDGLTGIALTEALEVQVRRAKQGANDAALVTGTGKDLLEATAAHILVERWGSYPEHANFPALLGQAFVALELATPQDPVSSGERPQQKVERVLYQLGCALNTLRNKEGTGHGRPWLPSVTEGEARIAVELFGTISEYMLLILRQKR
jgi:hypothetical protein